LERLSISFSGEDRKRNTKKQPMGFRLLLIMRMPSTKRLIEKVMGASAKKLRGKVFMKRISKN